MRVEPGRGPQQARLAGLLAMATACSIWGLGPIWIRSLLTWMPAVQVCWFRVTIAAAVLLPTLLGYPRAAMGVMLRNPASWLGGVAIAFNMLCYAAALGYLSPSEVNLLFQFNVVCNVVLGRLLFHEQIRPQRAVALATLLSGAAMVILSRPTVGPAVTLSWAARLAGVLLGMGAGLGGTLNQLCIRAAGKDGVGLPALLPMHLVAGVIFAVAGGLHFTWLRPPDAHCAQLLVLLGVVGSGTAIILANYALPRISLVQAGATGTVQPVVTILVSWAVFGQALPALAVLGALLVVGGVVWSATQESVASPPPSAP